MKKGEKRPDLYRATVKICPICNKQFRAVKDTQNRKQIYCSMACYRESRKNPIKELNCKYCGKPFYNREGIKTYCSHKCYAKHLETLKRGENSPLWKGGKTKESKRIKTTAEYKHWRLSVFIRDDFKCTKCGSKENLEAHHIKEQSRHPQLRFVLDNGQTLCHKCHKETDNYGCKVKKRETLEKRSV